MKKQLLALLVLLLSGHIVGMDFYGLSSFPQEIIRELKRRDVSTGRYVYADNAYKKLAQSCGKNLLCIANGVERENRSLVSYLAQQYQSHGGTLLSPLSFLFPDWSADSIVGKYVTKQMLDDLSEVWPK